MKSCFLSKKKKKRDKSLETIWEVDRESIP